MPARRVVAVAVLLALLAAACSGDDGDPARTGSDDDPDTGSGTEAAGDGFADPEWFRGRQDDYLAFATEELDPGSILNIVAHAERAERDDGFSFDRSSVSAGDIEGALADIEGWVDTSDFDVLYLLNLVYGYEDQLPPEMVERIEEALLGFEYWFTEPTPEDVVDQKYYWSENHRIIFHTDEYLMGQKYPDEVFTNDGRTGAEHRDEARERILDWLDEKAELGFTEFHSDVYYQKDVTPLLTLVEFAEDEEVATRAAMVLDLALFDMAMHLQNGNFGTTHGRSYMKDKSIATDQDTFNLAKLLFDDTDLAYTSIGDPGATLLARARNYRLPDVIRRVASSEEPMTDRERMGVPLDMLAPVTEDPEAPRGYDFDDPDNLDFWWERGAQPAWQLTELTLDTINTHDLWETPTFAPFQPLRDAVGDDVEAAKALVQSLAPILSFALLDEASTVTHRRDDVMLSTVQDFRPGTYGDQVHAWQATLDEEAVVFTTLPKNEPFQGADSYPDADGYWTGSGGLPRSAQHESAAIHLYAPLSGTTGALEGFDRLDYTHAFFPTERFDEVVRDGNWTFGRTGDGYVGLWSWRDPEYRPHDPDEVFTNGLTEDFDLVAPGGADNVWIVEVGDASEGTFEEFRVGLSSAEVTVEPRAARGDGLPGGFDVAYVSPTQGEMRLGQDGPFTVDGEEVPLRHELRHDNPWARVEFGASTYEITDDEGGLTLDFEAATRQAR